jgi:Flp pilus assembly protein TadD
MIKPARIRARRESMADLMKSNGRNSVILAPNSRLRQRAAAMRGTFLAAALCLGGCQSSSLQDVTGSIGGASDSDIRRSAAELGRRYDRNPDDKAIALKYARALRGMTENAQAVAILQRLAIKFPRDVEVLGAYGKALADAGRSREAAEVLAHAHTPERPDWSVLSAQGSVADQLGDHEQAQAYYAAALKIAPAQPHVLSNLGLSYALSKKLPQAETALQQAAAQHDADKPVRQNLALVLALEGKFANAEEVARRDLDAEDAAADVAAIRRMIAQSNTWKRIQETDTKPRSVATTHVGSNIE